MQIFTSAYANKNIQTASNIYTVCIPYYREGKNYVVHWWDALYIQPVDCNFPTTVLKEQISQ